MKRKSASSPPSSPNTRSIAASTRIAEALSAFVQKPNLTTSDVDAYMSNKPKTHWDYNKYWKAIVHSWIAAPATKWELITWYANQMKNKSIEAHIDVMIDVLDVVRRTKPTTLLASSFWSAFSETYKERVWWAEHVFQAIAANDEPYLIMLFKNNLLVPLSSIHEHEGHTWSAALNAEAVKCAYRTYDSPKVAMDSFSTTVQLKSDNANARAFMLAAIVHFPSTADLIFTVPMVLTIMGTCLERGFDGNGTFTDILDAIVKKLSFKVDANRRTLEQLWANLMLKVYDTMPKPEYDKICNILTFILRRYKMNLNNMYLTLESYKMRMTALLQANNISVDPFTNPMLWIRKNMPYIAVALIARNKKAILFMISLGATLKRCSFTLEDMTTDPEMLKLFLYESKATKIQRAYKTHMYKPEHPSQSTRNATWQTRLSK